MLFYDFQIVNTQVQSFSWLQPSAICELCQVYISLCVGQGEESGWPVWAPSNPFPTLGGV